MNSGSAQGFTLVEVIATLIVLALAGTAVAMSISTTKARIFMARDYMEHVSAAQSCMDRLAGDHEAARMAGAGKPIQTVIEESGLLGSDASSFCLKTSEEVCANREKVIILAEKSRL
ncbi:MAG: prepilin-type N-terminal cleavage/methylation domain-containing protein, partial [Desulfovibrionaceae bacterium]